MIRQMWPWATSFNRVAILCLFGFGLQVNAGGFPDVDAVLSGLHSETAHWTRQTLVLTPDEKKRVAEVADQKKPLSLVAQYVVRDQGEVVSYAYLDRHRVRTLPEILLVTLSSKGEVRNVQVLAFKEPVEYLADEDWYRQFIDMTAEDEVRMKRNIDGITGATLTARAGVQAVRRVLAVHQVLGGRTP